MRVGFIGVGNMGRPMALNAAAAGFDVMVYDRSESALASFRAADHRVAKTLADIASHAEIISLVVRDDAQVNAVVGDLLPLMQANGIIAVHATVKPATVVALAERAGARGLSVIDAPVSGGEKGAAARALCYMVGGDAPIVEQCRPLFASSAARIIHVGPVGHGSAAKLINNMIAFMNIAVAAEGFRLGARAGLTLEPLQESIIASSGRSHAVENWMNYPAIRAAYVGGPDAWMNLLRKDLDLALALARDLDIDAPMAAMTRELIETVWD